MRIVKREETLTLRSMSDIFLYLGIWMMAISRSSNLHVARLAKSNCDYQYPTLFAYDSYIC